jgi:GAF domain-containing protein
MRRQDDLSRSMSNAIPAGGSARVGHLFPVESDDRLQHRVLHVVQFYRDESFLAGSIIRFVRTGLARGDGVVLIATDAHVDALRAAASSPAFDLGSAVQAGRLIICEASEVLGTFLREDMPDEALFHAVIGDLVERARRASTNGRVRAYGEMVDVLWRTGNPAAVLRLEELWHQLLQEQSIELLCAYGLDSFSGGEHARFFREICERHSDVVPSERFADMPEAQRLRSIAELEQRASSLEVEAALRQRAEEVREQLFRAERAARDRASRLQRVTAALAEAVTPEEVATAGLETVMGALEAERGMVAMVGADGDPIAPIASSGEERDGGAQLLSLATESIRSCTPVFGATAFAIPLLVRGEAIGALNAGFAVPRSLGEEERDFVTSIAMTCAQALERTRLYQSERLARQEAELLFALSYAANLADTLELLYPTALDTLCKLVQVDRAAILLYDDEDVMRFEAWIGLSDAYRSAVEGHSPWARDERNPQPIFIDDAERDASLAPYRPLFAAEGIGALGFVPLLHRGVLIGQLMIYSRAPRSFSQRDEQLAATIASQVAQAVVRSQLFESERRARAHAEQLATRTSLLQSITASLSMASTLAEVALQRHALGSPPARARRPSHTRLSDDAAP